MLCGSVLGVWSYVEDVFNKYYEKDYTIQIVRVRADSKRFVGMLDFMLVTSSFISICFLHNIGYAWYLYNLPALLKVHSK